MGHQIQRILHDRVKFFFIILLLLLPSMEILQYLWDVFKSGTEVLPMPMYATFLAAQTRGHVLQSLLLWFLPLYLLIISGEDSLEDYRLGYKNILLGKMGKAKYIFTRFRFSFICGSFIIFFGLLLNFMLVQIIFHHGTGTPPYELYDVNNMPDSNLYLQSIQHPLVANISFILTTSLLAGLINVVGTSLAIVLHDKKIVYALTFTVWFGLILPKNSLMYVTQPFAEYDYSVLAPVFLWTTCFYLMIIVASYFWEVKIAKI